MTRYMSEINKYVVSISLHETKKNFMYKTKKCLVDWHTTQMNFIGESIDNQN